MPLNEDCCQKIQLNEFSCSEFVYIFKTDSFSQCGARSIEIQGLFLQFCHFWSIKKPN